MADQSINIKIADKPYHLKVSSPEVEQLMRLAAERINAMLAKYNEKFPESSLVDKLAFVALNETAAKIAARREMEGQQAEIGALQREIEVYLDKIESSR